MQSRPFFIIGCGRSGTTLLRTILNRHADIAIPLESLFIIDYLKAAASHDISFLISMLVREPEISEWGIRPQVEDFKGCQSISEVINQLHQIYLQAKGKKHWGQKTPRFVRETALLLEHFPYALFIHVVRDPRAVVSSLIHSDVHHSNAYHASKRWRMDVSKGLELEDKHPQRVMRVHYESLVRDSENTIRKILEFLGFVYDPIILQQDESSVAEYSKFYQNIHANLDRNATDQYIDKWKDKLSSADIEVVEALTYRYMQRLGYNQVIDSPVLPRGYKEWARLHRLIGLVRQTIRYLRYRHKYLLFLIWRKWKLGSLLDFLWDVNY
jgi:hypothetical protein